MFKCTFCNWNKSKKEKSKSLIDQSLLSIIEANLLSFMEVNAELIELNITEFVKPRGRGGDESSNSSEGSIINALIKHNSNYKQKSTFGIFAESSVTVQQECEIVKVPLAELSVSKVKKYPPVLKMDNLSNFNDDTILSIDQFEFTDLQDPFSTEKSKIFDKELISQKQSTIVKAIKPKPIINENFQGSIQPIILIDKVNQNENIKSTKDKLSSTIDSGFTMTDGFYANNFESTDKTNIFKQPDFFINNQPYNIKIDADKTVNRFIDKIILYKENLKVKKKSEKKIDCLHFNYGDMVPNKAVCCQKKCCCLNQCCKLNI